MSKRSISNYEEDIERIAQSIFDKGGVSDRESFDMQYDDFMEDLKGKQDTTLRNKAWKFYKQTYADEISKESTFKEAEGKSLKQDRRRTAKEVVSTQKEFKRRGAQHVDLDGLDTKQGKPVFKKAGRIRIKKTGRQKIVRIREDTITRQGKQVNIFRDKLGRFASGKRKK